MQVRVSSIYQMAVNTDSDRYYFDLSDLKALSDIDSRHHADGINNLPWIDANRWVYLILIFSNNIDHDGLIWCRVIRRLSISTQIENLIKLLFNGTILSIYYKFKVTS